MCSGAVGAARAPAFPEGGVLVAWEPGNSRLTCCHRSSHELSLHQPGSPWGGGTTGTGCSGCGLGARPHGERITCQAEAVAPFPRLEVGYYPESPRLPGRKPESCLGQAWHSSRISFELWFSPSVWLREQHQARGESSHLRELHREGRGGLIGAGRQLELAGEGQSRDEVPSGWIQFPCPLPTLRCHLASICLRSVTQPFWVLTSLVHRGEGNGSPAS